MPAAFRTRVADAFGADSDATATVNANGIAEVLLETKSSAAGYQIIGNQAVWLQALYDNVNVSTSSDAACHCFAGDATARSDIFYDTAAKVTGRDESFIETADLTVDANQNIDRYDKHANAHGGAFVGHHEPKDGALNAYRRIFWETTVIMLGEPNPSPDRRPERQDHEARQLSVTDENGDRLPPRSTRSVPGTRSGSATSSTTRAGSPASAPTTSAARRTARSGATPGCSTSRRRGITSRSSTRRPDPRHPSDRRRQRQQQRDHPDRRRPRPGPANSPADNTRSARRRLGRDLRVRHHAQLRADPGRDPQPPAGQASPPRTSSSRAPCDAAATARTPTSRSRTRSGRRSSTTSAAASSSAAERGEAVPAPAHERADAQCRHEHRASDDERFHRHLT